MVPGPQREVTMPIYEYKCQSCGLQEEKLEGLSAPDTHACPGCGEVSGMKRHLSIAAVSIAGSSASSYDSAPSCAGGSCPFAR
jgi:putative FmdB family regulatory protein